MGQAVSISIVGVVIAGLTFALHLYDRLVVRPQEKAELASRREVDILRSDLAECRRECAAERAANIGLRAQFEALRTKVEILEGGR
jgi:hypothetical protein